jgi:hypothetical protein
MRRRERPNQKRSVFPTSIVTNGNLTLSQQRKLKSQGRPITTAFITQDPVK